MSTRNILRLAGVLIVIGIVGNIVLYVYGESPFNLAAIDEERTVAAEQVRNIQIVSGEAEVAITPHAGNDIQIRLTGTAEQKWADRHQLTAQIVNNQLRIEARTDDAFKVFTIHSGTYHLEVLLPGKQYELLEVQTSVGSISAEGVAANQSVFMTSVGNIYASGITGKVRSETEVGTIELRFQAITDDVTAISEVGDITVTAKEAPASIRTDIRSTIGEETVTLPIRGNGTAVENEPNVKLASFIGNIALTLE